MGSSLRCQEPAPKHDQNDITWGILGCGRVSADFCEAFRNVSNGKIVACAASRSRRRAVAFGQRYGILAKRCYGSYEELCSDEAVQVIYIATMHSFHKEHALMALKAGKHVLIEKPMGMSADEAKVIIVAARQRGLFLMEGVWTRCFPAVREARRLLARGAIGRVTSVFADYGKRVPPHRRTDPVLGRGATTDMGIYPIASAAMAFGGLGLPSRVAAAGVLDQKTRIDVAASVSLVYGDRETASIHYSKLANTPEETRYVGTEGVITLNPGHCPTNLTIETNTPDGCGRRL
mmetsp:Transcript_27283/g.37809  ORF Transcript_27283/g.37809 Transcript_27283/m.37809 type:complete len:291 (+) Transcript_27283:23-895(+)